MDLGGSVSISPSYTFYYSRETGLNYIKNTQIARVYGDLVVSRQSISYIIMEDTENRIIKFKGAVNYLQMRIAYDTFCPSVLVGEKGREMGMEQLQIHYRVRKKVLFIIFITVLCWSFVGLVCQFLEAWLGLVILMLSSVLVLLIAILCIRFMSKTK